MSRPSVLFSKLSQAKVIGFVPPVAWSLLFFATPLAVMVVYSLWTYVDYRVESTWTFENYQDFFTRSTFHSALKNSAILTILTVVLSVVLAYPVAYGIAFKIPKRFQILVLITLIIPFWTSYVIRSYSWLTVLSENGIVNKFLIWLGIIETPLDLVYSSATVMVGWLHFFIMLLTFTIYASLVQISPSYFRAARDLGAGEFRTFLHVTLPMSMPGVLVGAFFTAIFTFGDYVTPKILGGNVTSVLPLTLVDAVSGRADYAEGAMVGVVMVIISVAIFLAFSRWVKLTKL